MHFSGRTCTELIKNFNKAFSLKSTTLNNSTNFLFALTMLMSFYLLCLFCRIWAHWDSDENKQKLGVFFNVSKLIVSQNTCPDHWQHSWKDIKLQRTPKIYMSKSRISVWQKLLHNCQHLENQLNSYIHS